MAKQLLGKDLHVLILERGAYLSYYDHLSKGIQNPSPTHAGHELLDIGPRPVPYNKVFAVGGATLIWGGVSPRMLPNDFQMKTLYGVAEDWPIFYDDLEPFYCEAEKELGVSGGHNEHIWPHSIPYPLPPFNPSPIDRVFKEVYQEHFCPLPLAKATGPYRDKIPCSGYGKCRLCPTNSKYTTLTSHIPTLQDQDNVEIICGYRALRFMKRSGGRFDALECLDDKGNAVIVQAKTFVVAANGVESVLILLASNLPSHSPLIGAYFFEHPYVYAAFSLEGAQALPWHGETISTGCVTKYMDGGFRSHTSGAFININNTEARPVGFFVERALNEGLRGQRLREYVHHQYRHHFSLSILLEVIPEVESRVSITKTKTFNRSVIGQVAGQPFREYTLRGKERVLALLQEEMGALTPIKPIFSELIPSADHLMGTCRMSSTPEKGVVDKNLRLWCADNVYVVSSAVFPTGGMCHATLTIAALACRLGTRLRDLH